MRDAESLLAEIKKQRAALSLPVPDELLNEEETEEQLERQKEIVKKYEMLIDE